MVITYTQTSTFTTTDPDKYGAGYVTTKPFADKASRLEYVAYLQSDSPNYSDVVSSSVVVRLPPPDNGGGGGGGGGSSSPLGVRDYVIIAIAAIFALGIFVRECMKRDKYAEGVAETGPRQHPLEETDDLEENDGSDFPVIPEESSDEDDEDDDDEEEMDDDDDDPFGPKEGRRSKLHEE